MGRARGGVQQRQVDGLVTEERLLDIQEAGDRRRPDHLPAGEVHDDPSTVIFIPVFISYE